MTGKKGQAAFEFLTTYGWAFLTIMIMVGALAYFGILNPSKLLPERCTLPSNFICQDYRMDGSTDLVNLRLRHNFGEVISLQNVTCTFDDGTTYTDSSVSGDWGPKETKEVECDAAGATGGLQSGNKQKVDVRITYRYDPSGYDHYGEGELYANAI